MLKIIKSKDQEAIVNPEQNEIIVGAQSFSPSTENGANLQEKERHIKTEL